MKLLEASQLNIQTQSLSLLNTLDLLSLLKEGDSIRAMVLEKDGSDVLLEVAGSNIFKASLSGEIDLSKGSMVNLFVKSMDEGHIVMQAVNTTDANTTNVSKLENSSFQNTLIHNMAFEQLERLNINPDNQNLQIAIEILKSGNTPDNKIISVINEAMKNYEELDIKSAVFLATKNMGLEQKNISALRQFDEGILQLGKGIFTLASDTRMNNLPELRNFTEYVKELFLKPEQMKSLINNHGSKDNAAQKENKINEMFKELYSKLDTVKNALNNISGHDYDSLTSTVEKYMQGIRFLNQLNREFTYVQIPVALNEYKTQGELFILRRRKGSNKKINSGDITMLLSLDTEKMGHVDTLLGISSKDIRLEIKTFKKDTLAFLRENNSLLFKILSSKGYRVVDIKYGIVKEKTSLLDFEDTLNQFLKTDKLSIDLRV
jgi:hypothetical protein